MVVRVFGAEQKVPLLQFARMFRDSLVFLPVDRAVAIDDALAPGRWLRWADDDGSQEGRCHKRNAGRELIRFD